MKTRNTEAVTEKIAALILRDAELGCFALAEQSGFYCADELLAYYPEFLEDARDGSQSDEDITRDFVLIAIEGDL